jgi:hypothetical protein
VNWGAPGNAYPVAVRSWNNTSVTFLAPTNQYEVDGHWEAALQGGSSATIQIVSSSGAETLPFSVNVVASNSPTPSISSVTFAAPDVVTIFGSNFGTEPALTAAPGGGYDQPVLQVSDSATNANYGYDGNGANWYGLVFETWSPTQITFAFGPTPPAAGDVLTFKLYSIVNGTPQATTYSATYTP